MISAWYGFHKREMLRYKHIMDKRLLIMQSGPCFSVASDGGLNILLDGCSADPEELKASLPPL